MILEFKLSSILVIDSQG